MTDPDITPEAVDRYNAKGYDAGMEPEHGGRWVRHSDYAALAAAMERERADRADLLPTLAQALHVPEVAGMVEAMQEIAAPSIFFLSRKDALEMRNTARSALAALKDAQE